MVTRAVASLTLSFPQRLTGTTTSAVARNEASLCQGGISGGVGARRTGPCGGAGSAVLALVLGPGSDLSEEPVFRIGGVPRGLVMPELEEIGRLIAAALA